MMVVELEKVNKTFDDWQCIEGYELNTLKVEIATYMKYRNNRDSDLNAFFLPLNERKEVDSLVKPMKNRVSLLTVEKSNLMEDMKVRKRVYIAMKKKLVDSETKQGKKGMVRRKLELKILINS